MFLDHLESYRTKCQLGIILQLCDGLIPRKKRCKAVADLIISVTMQNLTHALADLQTDGS